VRHRHTSLYFLDFCPPGDRQNTNFQPDSHLYLLLLLHVHVITPHSHDTSSLAPHLSLLGSWLLATASADGTIKLWDTEDGCCNSTLKEHSKDVLSVAFSPDGKHLASSGVDNTVRIWEPLTGREVKALNVGGISNQVTYSPEGRFLLVAVDKSVQLFLVEVLLMHEKAYPNPKPKPDWRNHMRE